MTDYTKGKSPDMLEPFFPNEIFRYIVVSCFLLVLEFVAIIVFPLPKFVHKPDDVPWFFVPMYGLRILAHNKYLFISMLVFGALLFVSWPFIAGLRKQRNHKGTNINL